MVLKKKFLIYRWHVFTIKMCKNYFKRYSQTCIKRSPLGQRKSGLSKQVTS